MTSLEGKLRIKKIRKRKKTRIMRCLIYWVTWRDHKKRAVIITPRIRKIVIRMMETMTSLVIFSILFSLVSWSLKEANDASAFSRGIVAVEHNLNILSSSWPSSLCSS